MSTDVKIFNACSHIVNDVQYEPQLCPRCYSKGYYFDINFESTGLATTTTGSIKLQQEMLKVLIDERNNNAFHPQWGSEIYTIVGHKNLGITKSKLEIIIRRALEHLKTVQNNEYMQLGNLTPEEILDQILYIEINAIGPTGWYVYVVISNTVGEVYTQTVTF